MDKCDSPELINPAFVNFVRERVSAWFEWRAEKAEHLKRLIQKYDSMETELAEVDARLCEFCTQDEEELIDDVLPPAEQKLEDQADELEDDLEELMGSIQQIRCDPNLVPTCGFDLIGRPVMLSDLTLESKCMLLAVWFRHEHRSLALLPEVVANELGKCEEGYLQEWLECRDLKKSPVHYKLCLDNQFRVIESIETIVLNIYRNTLPSADGESGFESELSGFSVSEARNFLGKTLVDRFDLRELTNVELQVKANKLIAMLKLPLEPFASDTGNGVAGLYKRSYLAIHHKPLLLDRRGRRKSK